MNEKGYSAAHPLSCLFEDLESGEIQRGDEGKQRWGGAFAGIKAHADRHLKKKSRTNHRALKESQSEYSEPEKFHLRDPTMGSSPREKQTKSDI